MKQYPFLISIVEANERDNIYFEDESEARIHFEELKKDADIFDMFLAAREEDGSYIVVETFVNESQHKN